MRNISCEFEISTYNNLCSRGPTNFQNEVQNIPRLDFMVMNISCKFGKASYNIFFDRVIAVKSLYILQRQRRCNKAKSVVSIGYYPVDTIRQIFKEDDNAVAAIGKLDRKTKKCPFQGKLHYKKSIL